MVLSFELVVFDGLPRITGVVDGDDVVLSSDLVCRGGTGGGRGTPVVFLFDSLSIK